MKFLLKKLCLILLTVSSIACAAKQPQVDKFSTYFWPDMADPKISLEKVIDTDFIYENRSFWGKFFGLGYEVEPLHRPFAVAANGSFIAVSDIMYGVINLIDRSDMSLDIIGTFDGKHLKSPVDLDFDENNLYIVDSGKNYIIRYNVLTEKSKFLDIQMKKPVAIKVDHNNQKIFLADTKRNKVIVTDLNGNILNSFGDELNYPLDIDLNTKEKKVYLLDSMNFRVVVFNYNGKRLKTFGEIGMKPGQFSKPKGLCLGKYNRLYITDADFDNFQIFNTEGQLLYFLGETGNSPSKFYMPERVYCYEDELYISDLYNSRVKMYKVYE